MHQHDIAIDALGDDTLVLGYLEQSGALSLIHI